MVPDLNSAWVEGSAVDSAGCSWQIQSVGASGPSITWADNFAGVYIDQASLDLVQHSESVGASTTT